jgi:hypothetical protein
MLLKRTLLAAAAIAGGLLAAPPAAAAPQRIPEPECAVIRQHTQETLVVLGGRLLRPAAAADVAAADAAAPERAVQTPRLCT